MKRKFIIICQDGDLTRYVAKVVDHLVLVNDLKESHRFTKKKDCEKVVLGIYLADEIAEMDKKDLISDSAFFVIVPIIDFDCVKIP